MPEARASTAWEHVEAVVLAAASVGVSRVGRELGESAGFLKREGCGRPETTLRKVRRRRRRRRRRRSDFILTG
jgi:hypothetical protein